MTLTAALNAMTSGDEAALLRFTREVVRLPEREWPYVAQAAFELREILPRKRNPIAYLRTVAMRIRQRTEDSLMGAQPVLDSHRRVIGTVHLTAYVSDEGEAPGTSEEDVCTVVATDMERRRRARAGTSVDTTSPEEASLQRLYLQGYSRRDAADILGWTILEVETIWDRLYRRRSNGSRRAPLRT